MANYDFGLLRGRHCGEVGAEEMPMDETASLNGNGEGLARAAIFGF